MRQLPASTVLAATIALCSFTAVGFPAERRDAWGLASLMGATGAWHQWSFPDSVPPGLFGAGAYDSLGDRMVVLGQDPSFVWTLSLGDPHVWRRIDAPGGGLESPQVAVATFDSKRRLLVAHRRAIGVPDTLWTLDPTEGARWSPMAIAGVGPPVGLSVSGLLYDRRRDRILFCGWVDTRFIPPNFPSWVWAVNLSGTPAWTQLTGYSQSGSPAGFYRAAVTDDSGADRMIIFGGSAGVADNYDAWDFTLDGSNQWRLLDSGGQTYTGAQGTALIHDPLRNRIIVFGGEDGFLETYQDTHELSLDSVSVWSPIEPSGPLPPSRAFAASIYDPIRDRLVVFGGFDGGHNTLNDTWSLDWDHVTPTLASLASVDATLDHVDLRWLVEGVGDVTVERSSAASSWQSIGTSVPDGQGFVRYYDASVAPGSRYGYRLRWTGASGEVSAGEVWVDVPLEPSLALAPARGNPSTGPLAIALSLRDNSPARLEVFDAGGRRVASRDVTMLGVGNHVVVLNETERLRPGVYLSRLTQGSSRKTARIIAIQ